MIVFFLSYFFYCFVALRIQEPAMGPLTNKYQFFVLLNAELPNADRN